MNTSAMIASSIRELRELASSTIASLGRDVKGYGKSATHGNARAGLIART